MTHRSAAFLLTIGLAAISLPAAAQTATAPAVNPAVPGAPLNRAVPSPAAPSVGSQTPGTAAPGAIAPPPAAPVPVAPSPLTPAVPRALTLQDLPDGPDRYKPKAPSDAEAVSLACIAGAAITGTATLLAGGVAIAATGGAATAAESAIAVPVLVATVAAGCGVAQSMAPGVAWLQRQGTGLVDMLENARLLERLQDSAQPQPDDVQVPAPRHP